MSALPPKADIAQRNSHVRFALLPDFCAATDRRFIMYAKAPYTVIQRAMHIHPTVSEFIPTMMENLKPLQ